MQHFGIRFRTVAVNAEREPMYSKAFCKVYNEFGWNYFPLSFGEQLLTWLDRNHVSVKNSMDLACGPGVLCNFLYERGIKAAGMDFSEGMIAIAREENPAISYEVADMIRYRPDTAFDLVTCTGDALNHITDLQDVEQIFRNVHHYLKEDGYFIFDILDESEIALDEPIELDWSDSVQARFQITRNEEGIIHLQTNVYENGVLQIEEIITEVVHDRFVICNLLRNCGFDVIQCDNAMLDDQPARGMKWFVIAKRTAL